MKGDAGDDHLSLDGFAKFVELVAPVSRALDDNTPLTEELRTGYEAVIADTDAYADQFLEDGMKEFMRSIAHAVVVRHPDRFMEQSPIMWASAIESFAFLPLLDNIGGTSRRRAMLGACRYFAPGVDDLLKKFGTYLPLPDRPTDPDVMAWFDLVADLQLAELQAAAPPVDDSEEKGGPYPAVRITDAVDYDDESVPQERRDYYRAIVRYTDFLGEFLDTSVKALMHDFARTAVTYGSAESLAVPPQDAALFIEVMTLGVLGSADESEPSPYDDIVQGLQRGHEELLETMRVIVGQAMIRGFEAEGRRRRTN